MYIFLCLQSALLELVILLLKCVNMFLHCRYRFFQFNDPLLIRCLKTYRFFTHNISFFSFNDPGARLPNIKAEGCENSPGKTAEGR